MPANNLYTGEADSFFCSKCSVTFPSSPVSLIKCRENGVQSRSYVTFTSSRRSLGGPPSASPANQLFLFSPLQPISWSLRYPVQSAAGKWVQEMSWRVLVSLLRHTALQSIWPSYEIGSPSELKKPRLPRPALNKSTKDVGDFDVWIQSFMIQISFI